MASGLAVTEEASAHAAIADLAPTPAPTPTPTAAPAAIVSDVVEADPVFYQDSSYGDDEDNSVINFGSVTPSIYRYRQENGGTYHAYSDGTYLLPNDDKEQERLDLVYHAFTLMYSLRR